MFQFRRFPSYTYFIQCRMTEHCSAGFPHSEISGSMRICRSPKLIAACHVLLRLLMPRHSPCALYSLICVRPSPLGNGLAVSLELCKPHKSVIFRNCNCYPSIRCSTIKSFSLFFASLLPCLSSLILHCSVFKVQNSAFAEMVEINGIEPLTPCLQSRCSPS